VGGGGGGGGGGKRRPCSGHVVAFPNLRVVGICTNGTGRS